MRTTPQMYFEFFVLEDYREFRDYPYDVRKGFNAAVSAFHMADVYYCYSERHEPEKISAWPTRNKFVIQLSTSEPQFNIVQSVATIYKHMYVTKSYLDGSSPQSIRGVVSRDGVKVQSGWRESKGEVVTVLRKDDSEVPLLDALNAVVSEMWPQFL